MEAVINHHASVGLLNLPLSGTYFHLHNVAPESMCWLFPAIGRGEVRRHPAPPENTKPLWQQPPSSRTCRSHPKTGGVKPEQCGGSHSYGEEPELRPGGPAHLAEQVELTKKMYDHVANLRRMTGPQVRLGKHLIERFTLKRD